MSDIKTTIKTVLTEERLNRLNTVYNELEDIRDSQYLSERYVTITLELLNEGYEIEELEIPDVLKSDNVKDALSNAAVTSAKEYIIRFILTKVFKANPGFSTFASQLFADWNPMDLLKIFKNKEECNLGFPKLSDRLLTMLVRYVSSNKIGGDSNSYDLNLKDGVSTYLGNLFGEVIEDSDVSEKISNKFCELIH